MTGSAGKVYLLGAGPGAADLITLRGAEILGCADAVVYDSLVNPALLQLAPSQAQLFYAGKRAGSVTNIAQEELNALLVALARKGMKVVRLKGGDPFIFARGGEEAQALAEAGVEFEVIPGVTSAIAAPAFAGIPLTHREHGSFVALISGHEDESKTPGAAVPWEQLARAAKDRGTLVILMATARLREIARRLVAAGLPDDTPAAAIQWGTLGSQKTVSATLASLAAEAERAGLGPPAVVVAGACVSLREHLKWAERMPLFGRRIVVTRAGAQISSIAQELSRLGAEVVAFPTIETVPLDSYEILDRAISRPDGFDWLVFTSATGVEYFIERLRCLRRDIRAIGAARICAIGPATARRLGEYALRVDAMPAEYRAEAIIDALGDDQIRGKRILIPRAQVAREVLPEMLVRAGAAEVVVAPAYRTVKPSGPALERMRETLASARVDLVTFTSSSTVKNFVEIVGKPVAGSKAAAIGPITAATARSAGFEVVVQPAEYTVAALLVAIESYFAR